MPTIRGYFTGIFAFGVYISEQISVDLADNDRVGLDFSLPGINQLIHLAGTITSISREKGIMKTHIGIQTALEPAIETDLMKYIDLRQTDILHELQQIYQRICPSKKI